MVFEGGGGYSGFYSTPKKRGKNDGTVFGGRGIRGPVFGGSGLTW